MLIGDSLINPVKLARFGARRKILGDLRVQTLISLRFRPKKKRRPKPPQFIGRKRPGRATASRTPYSSGIVCSAAGIKPYH
jgi:hypothetical protein